MNLFDTGRGLGLTDALHGSAEWFVILLFGLVTQLGDVWFLFLLGGVLYVTGDTLPRWGVDRRRGVFVIALVLTYVALIGGAKAVFQLPRPPGAGTPPELTWLPDALTSVVHSITTAAGSGFPSGHAFGATLVWGGLALVIESSTFWRRIGLATVVVLLVSVSRVVLGVHYVVDVVAGMGLGLLVLGTLYRLTEKGVIPGRALLAAVVVGVAGLFVGVNIDSVAACGSAVGSWSVWRGVADTTPAHPSSRGEVIAGFLVLGAAATLMGGVLAIEPPLLLTFVATTTAGGVAVGAPLLGEKLA